MLIFALAVVILFLIANRGAYKGFFTGDDFDHLANAREAELSYYGKMLVSPRISGDLPFRPVPHFYFFAMVRLFGFRFSPYITGIHLLHLLNVALVWMLTRALGAARLGASAGALLFAFHPGVFDVYWAPMYIFDLLCGTFVIASLLAYIRGRLIVSLVFFWLALKSKEVAIVLPVVLAGYEWWFGERRWKRLLPFLVISVILGIQALASNTHRDNDYTLRFTLDAVWRCASFYAQQLVLLPDIYGFVGFALLALPFFIRNRRVRFGMFSFVALLALMLMLPGRLFGAYLYVPLIGLAIALSAATRPVWLAVFFAVWMPWSYYQLRLYRKAELAAADERRAWFQPIAAFARAHPSVDTFIYDGAPESLASWGVAGAIREARPDLPTRVIPVDAPGVTADLARPNLALLVWDPQFHRIHVLPRSPDVSYIRLSLITPLWQLGEGWIGSDPNFRWIGPHATARLLRPAVARTFEVVIYPPDVYINQLHQGHLEVSLDHRLIGSGVFDKPTPTTFHFHLPPGPEGPVEVEFKVSPPLKDPAGSSVYYGTPIAAFGFR